MEHDFDLHLNFAEKKKTPGRRSRKYMKRCMAVLLSAVLATGTCLPALAADQSEVQEEAAGASGTTEAALAQPEENNEETDSAETDEAAEEEEDQAAEEDDQAEKETAEESIAASLKQLRRIFTRLQKKMIRRNRRLHPGQRKQLSRKKLKIRTRLLMKAQQKMRQQRTEKNRWLRNSLKKLQMSLSQILV